MTADVQVPTERSINIKVVNIGGCSNDVVGYMVSSIKDVEIITVNYDMSTVLISNKERCMEIDKKDTYGLDTACDFELGENTAGAFQKNIIQSLNGANIVFVVANMYDNSSLCAAQLVAKYAKEIGALTVGIVTKSLSLDVNNAENGIDIFTEAADTLIIIPNDVVLKHSENDYISNNFRCIGDIIYQSVKSITDLVCVPGIVGIDFADVKMILSDAGSAFMGIGTGKGEGGARAAAEAAVKSLFVQAYIRSSKKVLFNITGGRGISLFDVETVYNIITEAVDPNANIIFGAVIDESLEDEIRVTVIATGFEKKNPSVPGGSPRTIYGGPQSTIKNPEHTGEHHNSGEGIFKPFPRNDNTEIPPWLRG